MPSLTKILNGLLGVGANRRVTSSPLPKSQARIWEVRPKRSRQPRKPPGVR